MRTQKSLSRRDFLKTTGVIAGSALLSACSFVFEIPLSPTLTSLPTSTNTPIPTNTSTPTPTATPEPSPTPIPKPFIVEYQVGNQFFEMKMPFTTVKGRENMCEVVDFERWENLPVLSDMAHLSYWHDALRKATRSDGTPLVKPFPQDMEIPTWRLGWPTDFDRQQSLAIEFPVCTYDRQPLRIVGGFKYHYPIVDPSSDMWMVGASVQVAHPTDRNTDQIVTGLMRVTDMQGWIGLNNNTRAPTPRLGIPLDIKTNSEIASKANDFYAAFYLSQVNALDARAYRQSVVDWESNDFPPAYFMRFPYIASNDLVGKQQ